MNRNDNYVPDRLYLEGRPHLVEIAPPHNGQTVLARTTFGAPDEYNRDAHWDWADTSGDGSHWSYFQGHHVQIDIEFHTANRREVNDWKGRDEIRAEGTWTLALNRQQCWEGSLWQNPLDQLMKIRDVAKRMLEHVAIDWRLEQTAAEQLKARRVYYRETPAVIASTVMEQGCVMLKPVGIDVFPVPVYLAEDGMSDPYDYREVKVDLLDPHVWWWRDRLAGDES